MSVVRDTLADSVPRLALVIRDGGSRPDRAHSVRGGRGAVTVES